MTSRPLLCFRSQLRGRKAEVHVESQLSSDVYAVWLYIECASLSLLPLFSHLSLFFLSFISLSYFIGPYARSCVTL